MKNSGAVIRYILLLGAGVLLLWFAFRGVNLRETWNEIRHTNFFWLSVSVAASLVAFFSRAVRWNMLIHPLGYRPDTPTTSASLMIGYLANLAFPRLGEVTRCATLSKAAHIPVDSLIGTVILERIIDILCLLLCIALTSFIEFDRLGAFLTENIFNPIGIRIDRIIYSPVFHVFIVVLVLLLLWYAISKGERSKDKEPFLSGIIRRLVKGLTSIRLIRKPGWFLFHTALIWLMYYLMSYTCFQALPSTSGLGLRAGLFVLVAGAIGMSAPVQGGIGTYHILVSTGLVLYGISSDHGLAFATLMHTSQTLVVILLGAISLLYLSFRKKQGNADHAGNHPE